MNKKDQATIKAVLKKRPSRLVEMALKDMTAIEEDPSCDIDMDVWLRKMENGRCTACFSGAFLLKTLGVSSDLIEDRTDFHYLFRKRFPGIAKCDSDRLQGVIVSLSSFSRGWLHYGASNLGIILPVENVRVTSYHKDPEGFKKSMGQVVVKLRRHDL